MGNIDEWHKRRILRIKKTLDFISQHPEGVTMKDFEKAGLSPYGVELLVKLEGEEDMG